MSTATLRLTHPIPVINIAKGPLPVAVKEGQFLVAAELACISVLNRQTSQVKALYEITSGMAAYTNGTPDDQLPYCALYYKLGTRISHTYGTQVKPFVDNGTLDNQAANNYFSPEINGLLFGQGGVYPIIRYNTLLANSESDLALVDQDKLTDRDAFNNLWVAAQNCKALLPGSILENTTFFKEGGYYNYMESLIQNQTTIDYAQFMRTGASSIRALINHERANGDLIHTETLKVWDPKANVAVMTYHTATRPISGCGGCTIVTGCNSPLNTTKGK